MKPILGKYVLVLLVISITLTNTLLAQTSIWSVDAGKYIGKLVTFDEYANTVIYNSATKTCLIKLADPDVNGSPTITVIIHHVNKGKHLHWLQHLEGNTITITGKLLSNKNGFVINGDNSRTKIVDESNATLTDPWPVVPEASPTKRDT